jgi:hypothetical protein
MAAPRTFTEAELATAQSMRSQGESWRAIGRVLSCNEDTIRCQFDDEYRKSRHSAIAARRVEQRRVAKAVAEKSARRADAAYRPLASLGLEAHPGRIAKGAANSGGGKIRVYFAP